MAGIPFFKRCVQSVFQRSVNMRTLIGLGTSAAFLYSVAAFGARSIFPASFVALGRVSVYFEAAAGIISLTLLGQILELRARSPPSTAIKSLLGLAPKTARRKMFRSPTFMSGMCYGSRAPMQSMADHVSGYFVIAVVKIALLTLFVWGLFGTNPSWAYGLINAVTVLIIACPCALGLTTPMSIMVATGNAATQGVLFRDAAAIENFRKVDTLIVDKTGTLTKGKLRFDRSEVTSGHAENEVLPLAASLDQGSEDPLAAAIVTAARERGLALAKADQFESILGIGVRGIVEGKPLAIGNTTLMSQLNVSVESLKTPAEALRAQVASVMYLAIDKQLAGLVGRVGSHQSQHG